MDDEQWMLRGLQVIIEEYCPRFEVFGTAAEGEEALFKIQRDSFDVILLDINMPGMDGIRLLHEMKQRQISIPTVVITGHEEFQYARQAFRLGALDYLVKPLDREEIRNVLSQLEIRLAHQSDENIEQKNHVNVVQFLLDKIENHYTEDLAIADLAEQTGYNPSYLSRMFKLETGKAFVQSLMVKRMQVASKLLEKTVKPVYEIAQLSGYPDDKYFMKIFKRELGITPAEYRRKSNK